MRGKGAGGQERGELGGGVPGIKTSPSQVDSSTLWNAVATGASTFALRSDGTLWSFGNNTAGDLGIGNQASGSPDFTFAQNANTYVTLKRLTVLVHPTSGIVPMVVIAPL